MQALNAIADTPGIKNRSAPALNPGIYPREKFGLSASRIYICEPVLNIFRNKWYRSRNFKLWNYAPENSMGREVMGTGTAYAKL
jgi:hypothetical protein